MTAIIKTLAATAAATIAALALAQPAAAGPGFVYSWLSTDKSFDQCMTVANDMASGLGYPHIEQTKFGITGEKENETLYINCEDLKHISVVLVRLERPQLAEIDMIVGVMENRLGFAQ